MKCRKAAIVAKNAQLIHANLKDRPRPLFREIWAHRSISLLFCSRSPLRCDSKQGRSRRSRYRKRHEAPPLKERPSRRRPSCCVPLAWGRLWGLAWAMQRLHSVRFSSVAWMRRGRARSYSWTHRRLAPAALRCFATLGSLLCRPDDRNFRGSAGAGKLRGGKSGVFLSGCAISRNITLIFFALYSGKGRLAG